MMQSQREKDRRLKNSQYHLLLAERMFRLNFKFLHVLVSYLGAFPGASAFVCCKKKTSCLNTEWLQKYLKNQCF